MMDSYSMGFGSIYMFAVWHLVGFSTYALIKLFERNKINTKKQTGLDILKKRYASGEIDTDEYQTIKNIWPRNK